MMLQGCRKADRAEVVERDRFATPNSLKSHGERNLLSPFSNTCAITLKLCMPSRPMHPSKNILPGTQINVPRLNLHKRPRHRRCPTSRDFVPWRFSDAGRRSAWIASSCRHPKTYTGTEVATTFMCMHYRWPRCVDDRSRSIRQEPIVGAGAYAIPVTVDRVLAGCLRRVLI